MLPTVTINGRAVADPELRFTANGKAVANVRVAASERRKNEQSGEWEDGDKLFVNASVWGDDAETVAAQVTKGARVLVEGRLFEREYETREGVTRKSVEVKYATVGVIAASKPGNRQPAGQQADPMGDPWAVPPAPAVDNAPPF